MAFALRVKEGTFPDRWPTRSHVRLPLIAASSAAKVRANHAPRGVSRAEALFPIMVTINIPSRARSAIVMPYIRAPEALAGDAVHTPRLL